MNIHDALRIHACSSTHGIPILPFAVEDTLCAEFTMTKRALLIEACSLGIMPERYSRNASTYTTDMQKTLLSSSVAVVGMGGLGGNLLESLARIGIGRLICADGDSFEASNLNRQAFSSERSLGYDKASVGYQRLADISSVCECTALPLCINSDTFASHMGDVNIVIDALGGLRDKPMLAQICASLKLPLIASSIAGLCGYVSYVPPGACPPTHWLGDSKGIEEVVGNLPQAVLFAVSCIIQVLVDGLCEKVCESRSFLFDVERFMIERVVM